MGVVIQGGVSGHGYSYKDVNSTFAWHGEPVVADANGNATVPTGNLITDDGFQNGQTLTFEIHDVTASTPNHVAVVGQVTTTIPAACAKPSGSGSKSPKPSGSASKSTSHHGGNSSSSSNVVIPVNNGNSAPGAPIGGTSDGIPTWEYAVGVLVLFGGAVMTASSKARELVMKQVRRAFPRGRFAV